MIVIYFHVASDNLFDVVPESSDSMETGLFKTGPKFEVTNFPKKYGKRTSSN